MLKFRQFIKETPPLGTSEMGTDIELRVGQLLNRGEYAKKPAPHPNISQPKNKKIKSQYGITPKSWRTSVYNKFRPEKHYKDHYEKMSKGLTNEIQKHVTSTGAKILGVYHTSNKQDIPNLIGHDDKGNPSDLVLHVRYKDGKEGHIGYSLKAYKSAGATTLANPGHKSMDKFLKVNTTKYMHAARKKIHNNMRIGGHNTREMNMAAAHALEKKHPHLKAKNKEILNRGIQAVTKIYAKKFLEMDKKKLKHTLEKFAQSKPYKIPVYRASAHGAIGKSLSFEVVDAQKQFHDIMHEHGNHLHVHSVTAQGVIIAGKDNKKLMTFGFKGKGSGGFTAMTGRMEGWHEPAATRKIKHAKELKATKPTISKKAKIRKR